MNLGIKQMFEWTLRSLVCFSNLYLTMCSWSNVQCLVSVVALCSELWQTKPFLICIIPATNGNMQQEKPATSKRFTQTDWFGVSCHIWVWRFAAIIPLQPQRAITATYWATALLLHERRVGKSPHLFGNKTLIWGMGELGGKGECLLV